MFANEERRRERSLAGDSRPKNPPFPAFWIKLSCVRARAKEPVMPYFDQSQDIQTRVGKVIGDIIAGLIYLAVVALALNIMVRIV